MISYSEGQRSLWHNHWYRYPPNQSQFHNYSCHQSTPHRNYSPIPACRQMAWLEQCSIQSTFTMHFTRISDHNWWDGCRYWSLGNPHQQIRISQSKQDQHCLDKIQELPYGQGSICHFLSDYHERIQESARKNGRNNCQLNSCHYNPHIYKPTFFMNHYWTSSTATSMFQFIPGQYGQSYMFQGVYIHLWEVSGALSDSSIHCSNCAGHITISTLHPFTFTFLPQVQFWLCSTLSNAWLPRCLFSLQNR